MTVPNHVQAVLDRLGDTVRPNGSGWVACCPAHEDREPSLSVGIGQGGKVLLTCFAGCEFAEIVAGLGMTPAEMFPADDRKPSRGYGSHKPKKATATRPAESAPTGKVYPSPWDAARALTDKHGPQEKLWYYRTADRELVGQVYRFKTKDGKTFRPVAKHADGWRVGAMPGNKRPLYCLPDLAQADHVFVVEGEKCVDAVQKIKLKATTSVSGSQAAGYSDWSPLAGKTVSIIPDHDDPGRKYAAAVAEILSRLSPPPTVRVLDPVTVFGRSDLPAGYDIADAVEAAESDADRDALRAAIEAAEMATDARPVLRDLNAGAPYGAPDPAPPAPTSTDGPGDTAGREVVNLGPDEDRVAREVIAALASRDDNLYVQDGQLVEVAVTPKGRPKIVPLSAANVRCRVTATCRLLARRGENLVEANPPPWLAAAVRDYNRFPGVRELSGVATSPVLRPDGTVHQTAGYDPATRLLYMPSSEYEPIPESPTLADAKAAAAVLLAGVRQFPWETESDPGAWLAEVLGNCGKLTPRLLGPDGDAPLGQGLGPFEPLGDRAECRSSQPHTPLVHGRRLPDDRADAPPSHRPGPPQDVRHRPQQRPVPVPRQNPPAPLDRVILAVVRRQVHELDGHPCRSANPTIRFRNWVRELATSGPLSSSMCNRVTPGWAAERSAHHRSRPSARKSLVCLECPNRNHGW